MQLRFDRMVIKPDTVITIDARAADATGYRVVDNPHGLMHRPPSAEATSLPAPDSQPTAETTAYAPSDEAQSAPYQYVAPQAAPYAYAPPPPTPVCAYTQTLIVPPPVAYSAVVVMPAPIYAYAQVGIRAHGFLHTAEANLVPSWLRRADGGA